MELSTLSRAESINEAINTKQIDPPPFMNVLENIHENDIHQHECIEQEEQQKQSTPITKQFLIQLCIRFLRRFGKGFIFGFLGKALFGTIGICIKYKFNLFKMYSKIGNLLIGKYNNIYFIILFNV
jgi:hypothetical protein